MLNDPLFFFLVDIYLHSSTRVIGCLDSLCFWESNAGRVVDVRLLVHAFNLPQKSEHRTDRPLLVVVNDLS